LPYKIKMMLKLIAISFEIIFINRFTYLKNLFRVIELLKKKCHLRSGKFVKFLFQKLPPPIFRTKNNNFVHSSQIENHQSHDRY
jgi:hypothetical protein